MRRTFGQVNPSVHSLIDPGNPLCRLLAVGVLSIFSAAGMAAFELGFSVDDIEGEGWRADGIAISLSEVAVDHYAVAITVANLVLPDSHGTLEGLRLECPDVSRDGSAWLCEHGRLKLQASPIEPQDATWQGSYVDDGHLQITIPRLALAQGTVALELNADDGVWSARLQPHRTTIARLAALSGQLALPSDWGIEGRASGLVKLGGGPAGLESVDADLVFDQLAYASPDGTQAAEKVVIKTELRGRVRKALWRFDATLAWPSGAAYAEPLFIDASDGPVTLSLSGSWSPQQVRLQLDGGSLELAGTAAVSATGLFQGPGLAPKDLTIALHSDDAGRLYGRLLQPFLIGTPADDMQVAGHVGLVLHFDEQGLDQAGLEIKDLALEDRQGRFALDDTDGSIGWDRSKVVPVSRLAIAGASIYRIPTGAFDVRVHFAADRIDLVEPVVVPVLGGSIALDRFALSGALIAGARPKWEASASLRDVSLEQLTRTLEWPPFNGSLSAQLRELNYVEGLFSVGGGLEFSAFGGRIEVSGLSIQDPLGTVPVLKADAIMRGLELEALTETFAFGRIEGRLDADMRSIQLVGWQPDRFDLHLYTPQNDDSRHRISQRAVENLTELGSGVPAGLSATVLRVFDEFRYDRIDLRILLQGRVADLDGLARPDGGYYLVKGSGLPRIDVIGRNRSVAWKDLVERLQQIQVEGAQIK